MKLIVQRLGATPNPNHNHHKFFTGSRYVATVHDIAMSEARINEPVRRKPTLVALAAIMLATGGALFAGEVLLSVNRYFTGMRVYEQAAADGVIENEGAFAAVGVALHGIPALVGIAIGGGLVALSFFTAFGYNWARAVSWILGVPVLIWYGILVILHFALLPISESGAVDYSVPAELTQRYQEAWPEWLDSLEIALTVSAPLALIIALVCQTVPAVDAYFRPRRQPAMSDGQA